jgi:hypothetical protein
MNMNKKHENDDNHDHGRGTGYRISPISGLSDIVQY